tara:strand:+ start:592 stop:1761 length:1170 start_codon:yes stop_codon:yes gene_type:complete
MAISIIQTPNAVNLAQSPIVFAVSESNSEVFTSSSYQYLAQLYYWTGSASIPAVADYTLSKYPNTSRTGIFDVSRVINSELSDISQEVSSSVRYFAVGVYEQYLSGSTFVTGSTTVSSVYKAIDGYSLFQEPITQTIQSKTDYWPLMTDGPATQSFQPDSDNGRMSVWLGSGSDLGVTQLIYSGNIDENSLSVTGGQTSTENMVGTFPIGVLESDFPIASSNTEYSVQAYSGSEAVSEKLNFTQVCDTKYDNIRVKWKNRYGQFDYYNFNLVSRQSMNTSRQRYQPQIGSWNARTLSYEQYENSVQNYIVDSTQKLSVNSNYVSEDYNDIFKQLMVSDEVYWVTGYTTAETLMPLAVQSSNFSIKTTKVDKLIQYSFEFIKGQGYKLII